MKKAIYCAIFVIATVCISSFSLEAQVATTGPAQVTINPGESITVTSNPCNSANPVVHINSRPPSKKKSAAGGSITDSYNNYVTIVNNNEKPEAIVMPTSVPERDYRYHDYPYIDWSAVWLIVLFILLALFLFWRAGWIKVVRTEQPATPAQDIHIHNNIPAQKAEAKPPYDIKDAMNEAKSAGASLKVYPEGGFRIDFPKPEEKKPGAGTNEVK